ncbi:MAG: hypothetical protein Q3996_01540 [Candidatus Saccharibacteria bacterium]|nr:hypothetical protein [Candidatus Saccharibacteria bacterium]
MDYWRKQDPKQPIFESILWSKPDQINQTGQIGLVGGTKSTFLAVSQAWQAITNLKVQTSSVLPAELKPILKNLPNTVFADTNPSGGLSQKALPELLSLQNTTDGLLLVGDAGKNSETSLLYENFIRQVSNDKPIIITRDAIELVSNAATHIVNQDNIVLIMSFSQTQKLFRSVFYPTMLLFSMPIVKIIEALHKFTITYRLTIVLFHQNQLFIAHEGQVISTEFTKMTDIWQGILQAKIACWCVWNPQKLLEAAACATI